jgi:hypothetical protein
MTDGSKFSPVLLLPSRLMRGATRRERRLQAANTRGQPPGTPLCDGMAPGMKPYNMACRVAQEGFIPWERLYGPWVSSYQLLDHGLYIINIRGNP